jgi:hypothetical protein
MSKADAKETVPVGTTEGLRFNKGKIDLTQLSPLAQMLESLVYQYGAVKYLRDNYKGFKLDTPEMSGEDRAKLEFLQCAKRHLMAYERGEFFDPESKMPHLAHVVWNLNRIMDVVYYGCTHGKDGKDLFHQPLRQELPPVPTLENFEAVWGIVPLALKQKKEG